MNIANRFVAGTLACWLLLACVARAEAQLAPGGVGANPKRANAQRQAEPGAEARKEADAALTLRCWQFGRLILEEPVSAPPSAPGAVVLSRPGDGGPVELIKLGESLCLVR